MRSSDGAAARPAVAATCPPGNPTPVSRFTCPSSHARAGVLRVCHLRLGQELDSDLERLGLRELERFDAPRVADVGLRCAEGIQALRSVGHAHPGRRGR